MNSEVIFYIADTERAVENPRRGVSPGRTSALADINLTYSVSSGISIDQTVTWFAQDSSIATVNETTGAVTGVSVGTTTIHATARINGVAFSSNYTLVVSEIPISGSEIEYERDIWNYSPVLNLTNCYAYAFNNQTYPGTNALCYMQPGEFAGLELRYVPINAENVVTYVEADATKLGFMFEEIDKYSCCPTGSYKVALVIAEGSDYHWYRQNPDGTWSHKLGNSAVTDVDASGNILVNPEYADRNHTVANYSQFIAYYCVTPLNNMFDPTAFTQLELSATNASECENIGTVIDITETMSIVPGMLYDEVIAQIGVPDRYRTSSLRIAEYDLCDNSVFVVEFTANEGQVVVKSCQIEGGNVCEEGT